MRWTNLILVVMLTVLCAGGADALGPETVVLHVEQQRPCSFQQLADQDLVSEEFSGCADIEIRGTVLNVGGASIRQTQVRRDGQWVDMDPKTFGEHEKGDVLTYRTVLRVVYPGDLEPLEILGQEQEGSTVTYQILNWRRTRSIRIYVGDTAEYVRLTCVLDGREIICKNVIEV